MCVRVGVCLFTRDAILLRIESASLSEDEDEDRQDKIKWTEMIE